MKNYYLKLVNLSKAISRLTKDKTEKAKYEDYATQLAVMAKKFGSIIESEIPQTTFNDVHGLDKAKELVKSFSFLAKNPGLAEKYHLEGGLGLLLYGAPGTGKTLFAEAVANELNYVLYTVKPSEIFNSYVGESEKAVKQLFDEINSLDSGVVLFVDECESLFSKRKAGTDDYKIAVTNEILQGMNGFGKSKNQTTRIMIAATNMPWLLDSAYLRFKRFTYQVHITPPDNEAMKAIIKNKLKDIPRIGNCVDDDWILSVIQENVKKYDNKWSAADLCGALEEVCRQAFEQLRSKHKEDEFVDIENIDAITDRMFDIVFTDEKTAKRGSISPKDLQLFNDFEKGKRDFDDR